MTSLDYAFKAPDTIVAGATTFHLVNKGPSQHHLVIFALPEGMSLATFDRLMRADSVGGTGIEVVGGAEAPADGATDAWATLDLAPGNYALTCLLPLPDGSGTHRSRGMFRALTVVPAAGKPARMPHADVVVRMTDYAFDSPATIPAGRRLVRFENAGAHSHLALVARLAPGKTLADAEAWQVKHDGPQPFVYVGGVTAMAPGRASIARLDLEPGRYFIACVDNDGTAPKLHYEVGMVREFTAQ
ncbi:MAG TPA: hypothetical protein VFT57_15515 [Gemmatimonadaceae bacterium]|nr:hypothetical protein [Gemmatimonadaceae bacterium]